MKHFPDSLLEQTVAAPNIFDFATSELSQDAFICWLLSWADRLNENSHKSLHQTGKAFLDALFNATNGKVTKPEQYEKIEVKKQYKNIDVLVIVNDTFAIIIEDKTNTQNHSDQLRRYFAQVESEEKVAKDKIAAIYLKTGDQASYREVEEAGYSVFGRRDLLNVLETGKSFGVDNSIFLDFHKYLLKIEEGIAGYESVPVANWQWSCWTGFFLELQKRLGEGSWDYVPNPSGGFMGFWWYWRDDKYLQLEMEKLCFKIEVEDESKQSARRNDWHAVLIEESVNAPLAISKPSRFGKGTYMTVAILDDDYRRTDSSGLLDIDATVSVLRQAQELLDSARNRIDEQEAATD